MPRLHAPFLAKFCHIFAQTAALQIEDLQDDERDDYNDNVPSSEIEVHDLAAQYEYEKRLHQQPVTIDCEKDTVQCMPDMSASQEAATKHAASSSACEAARPHPTLPVSTVVAGANDGQGALASPPATVRISSSPPAFSAASHVNSSSGEMTSREWRQALGLSSDSSDNGSSDSEDSGEKGERCSWMDGPQLGPGPSAGCLQQAAGAHLRANGDSGDGGREWVGVDGGGGEVGGQSRRDLLTRASGVRGLGGWMKDANGNWVSANRSDTARLVVRACDVVHNGQCELDEAIARRAQVRVCV
jgi:hypothetical protein